MISGIRLGNSAVLSTISGKPLSFALPSSCLIRITIFNHNNSKRLYSSKTHKSLDSAPIEFLSNLTKPKFLNVNSSAGEPSAKLAKALSCTDDVSPVSTVTTPIKTTSDLKLQTEHIPFKVQTKHTAWSTATDQKKKAFDLDPYIKLTKPRLTALVVLSAICSYALTPFNATLPQLIFLTLGTGLCSSSANAINQGREPDFDKLMVRTVSRPIVRGLLTSEQAYKFAALTGTLGVGLLYAGVNSTVALLGGANIVLYGWIYTSLKRKHIINTWVGAIVGAIPPLMGWAASSPLTHPGALCLAALLYAWQFPHFNALSHGIKNEYRNAGYVMMAWTNPRLNARVGLRYALLMFPICFGLTYFGVTDAYFQIDSALLNGWMAYWAYKFWDQQNINYKNGAKPTAEGMKLANIYAKKAFWGSVWHLPGVLVLAMLHKKGRWDWLFGTSGNGIALRA
ncbi:hypothetical protein WICPIJ_007039 [Wickerhamomyces pijperi]|uniref:Protoheme IX farnesyltransferase, mitochondrial n=1 Tax=Wickerhamomyces pijperi TaxID=599730 RepID=A0A9P8TKD3_WICPI|nr:hypothetical protein WICPIJ_007039 [Wickerhamomyces pijperi]